MVPHRWDGHLWTCAGCGHVSPDPCDCICNPRCRERSSEHEHTYEYLGV